MCLQIFGFNNLLHALFIIIIIIIIIIIVSSKAKNEPASSACGRDGRRALSQLGALSCLHFTPTFSSMSQAVDTRGLFLCVRPVSERERDARRTQSQFGVDVLNCTLVDPHSHPLCHRHFRHRSLFCVCVCVCERETRVVHTVPVGLGA